MKLRQIKLAGFKTFVDPTTIKLDGQLAGIVGPNGCGKSNIMESVKWVLGSSSAKDMRGESMDSVIFNGTDTRQAIGRASVELVFDNSNGAAPAEWASYAEISVKRIIEKEKGSTYQINNTTVRRKDVADLFLGTGLGARGYAIIGQNTVSQIVEAKPEELKNYLEEAAGVSKYKERRKETEFRLRDTRDNLERVNDLLREINQQITKLESQAQTAKKHNDLQEKLKFTRAQIHLLKKRIANSAWEETKEAVAKITIQLDKYKADLTNIEAAVETARQEHIQASDSINISQAKFYEMNSSVTDTENRLNNLNEKIARLAQLKESSQNKFNEYESLNEQLTNQLNENEADLSKNQQRMTALSQQLEENREQHNNAEDHFKKANQYWQESSKKLQSMVEQLNVESATVDLSEGIIRDLNSRIASLGVELKGLESTLIEVNKPEALQDCEDALKNMVTALDDANRQQANLIETGNTLNDSILLLKQEVSEAEINISTLKQMDSEEIDPSKLNHWLDSIGSTDKENIFTHIKISDGWEAALGNILGPKINAYQSIGKSIPKEKRPPYSITIITSKNSINMPSNSKLKSALDVVTIAKTEIQPAIREWLNHVYIAEQEGIELESKKLNPGEILIAKNGDVYGMNYQILNKEFSGESNHLQRMKKIEVFEKKLPGLKEKLLLADGASTENKNKQQALKESLETLQTKKINLEEQRNAELIEYNKQLNLVEVNKSRAEAVRKDIENLSLQVKDSIQKLNDKKASIINISKNIGSIRSENSTHNDLKNQAEKLFSEKRTLFNESEKLEQEIGYNVKVLVNKITDVRDRLDRLAKDKDELLSQLNESNDDGQHDNITELRDELKRKLELKENAEKELVLTRERVSEKESKLRMNETARLEAQHAINPVTESLQQARLNEREATVVFEQCCQALNQCNITEDVLDKDLKDGIELPDLEELYETLGKKIERLGPVNLAAISELEGIRERQTYIQKQVQDLQDASKTLQDAIQKIDAETREKLKLTYQEVNKNFNEFFKTLFNGGHAQLELLGQEILDTGIQVVAQPPGKKNTTIHLLSGGEKAMTAIALVFALFKLNPSPFCLMDEVDAPLDDSNTERFCEVVKSMSKNTQFLFVSHNKVTMEIAEQLIGVTMQEPGVSRIVEVDLQQIQSMELSE